MILAVKLATLAANSDCQENVLEAAITSRTLMFIFKITLTAKNGRCDKLAEILSF
jgi:hypothetical protein